ncbi:MAG: PAS domain S-box protein [bacterium]
MKSKARPKNQFIPEKTDEKWTDSHPGRLHELMKEQIARSEAVNEQLRQEITELRRTEEILRINEEKYRSLYFSMSKAAAFHEVIYDQAGQAVDYMVLDVNPLYEAMVGLQREMIIGRKASEIYGTDRVPHLEIYEKVAATGHPTSFEVFFSSLGKYLIISVFSSWPGRFATLFTDITEYKQTEEALKESESEYSNLVNKAKDSIAIVQEGLLQFVNEAAEKMTGHTVEELRGKPFHDLIAPDYRELISRKHTLLLAGAEPPSICEAKLKTKDGLTRDVEFSVSIIQYHGKPALMAIVRDITERKKMEEELQRIQKLESIGTLAGGIAHDFNNLLTAIGGNLSFGKMQAKEESSMYEILTEAENACQQAKNLTQQLLTFSKGGEPIKKAASIPELVKDTVSLALCGSKVKYELSFPDDLWQVEIDKGQVSQAIGNLVINADQAMPEGGVISIRAENMMVRENNKLSLKGGRYVKVSVKDQGVGIQSEHLQKIFDPYFTTKQNRSGLGLATAYAIIKKHAGYITVESRVKGGTTFSLFLPALDEQTQGVNVPVKEKLFHGQRKILFMDDQKIIRDMVRRMLAHLKYEVELASDGHEAVELFKKAKALKQPFDAVILDLTIPGGQGGKEAIQILREIDPQVKAIVSSGYSNDPVMSDYKRYGFSGVVVKPYDFAELTEALSRLISSRP